jgi:hypothetical protein
MRISHRTDSRLTGVDSSWRTALAGLLPLSIALSCGTPSIEPRHREVEPPLGSREYLTAAAERHDGPELARGLEAAHDPKRASGSDAPEIAEIDAERLYLEPNVVDVDGTPAYVHFTERDMPLTVSVPLPESSAVDSTTEETRRAAISGFEAWAYAIRRIHPWFELDVREEHPDPDIRVRWSRRPRGYLPARGTIGYRIEAGALRVTGEIVLSTQPIPAQSARVSAGQLRVHAMHALGSALGLPDCRRCDSMMSLAWLRRDAFRVTDLDLRTLQALTQKPNGLRVDGRYLVGMRELVDAPALSAVPGFVAPAPEPGVLADLPFINTGRATRAPWASRFVRQRPTRTADPR